jgi:hypothetical protein
MTMFRRVARVGLLGGLVGGLFVGEVGSAAADTETVFAGCVTDRTENSVTLDTSARESVTINTTWLTPGFREILAADCVTITTVMVEGKYMAESVEQGDEPNEVHGLTNETTNDRTNKSSNDDDDDGNGKNGGNND